jgi:hypothetical protein
VLKIPVYTLASNTRVPLDWNLSYTSDLDVVLSLDYKIAAVPIFCTEPSSFDFNPVYVSVPWNLFDLVVLSDIEYFSLEEIDAWTKKIGIQKYVLAMGSRKSKQVSTQNNVLWRPWWVYNILNENTYQETHGKNKEFLYDVLLGSRRFHRDFVMLSLQASGLIDRSIVTYRNIFNGDYHNWGMLLNAKFPGLELQYPYVSPNLKDEWEVKAQLNNFISKIVPWDIYQNTYYSIVCETLGDYPPYTDTFFMSEKTAKVFLAKRIFVMFGSHNFLENLRSEGFQTFSSVLDESYDQIQDPVQRYAAAWAQVEWLATQDADSIYQRLESVIEHNHQHLFEHKKNTSRRMQEILKQFVPESYYN